jgi:hypothetical protein
MSHRILTHTAALGLVVAAVAAPVAAAQQDLRSPDAADAAVTALGQRAHDPQAQDFRSPDARDTAAGRGTFTAPRVTVVKVAETPQATGGGFDWGDAGIGAAGMLALFSIAAGLALMVGARRRRGLQVSAH